MRIFTKLAGLSGLLGLAFIVSPASVQTASAMSCVYWVLDGHNKQIAQGTGRARKKSVACKRAKRRCVRRLARVSRNKGLGRGYSCRLAYTLG